MHGLIERWLPTVFSDRAEAAFGHTLKQQESAYLAEVLRGALSA